MGNNDVPVLGQSTSVVGGNGNSTSTSTSTATTSTSTTPTLQPWNGSTDAPSDIPPIVADPVHAPSAHPMGQGGGQNTSVDVPSLRAFAANVRALKAPVQTALASLRSVDVHPGAFGTANTMRTKVSSHRDEFETVLTTLIEGLEDLGQASQNLATTYETTEDQNTMTSRQLSDQMAEADGDFSGILTAAPPT